MIFGIFGDHIEGAVSTHAESLALPRRIAFKTTMAAEHTAVRFRTLTPEEIARYIATGEPMDKAGAYGIQGRGALFVAHLDGDYFNVMGLPLCRLGQLLNELGVELL